MGWQTTPHVVVLLGSAVVCPLPVGYAVWYTDRYGFDRTVLSFGVLLAGMAVYSFARGIQLGHTGRAEKLLWARLLYLGFAPGVAAWFVFSVEYNSTSARIGRRGYALLGAFALPASLTAYAATGSFRAAFSAEHAGAFLASGPYAKGMLLWLAVLLGLATVTLVTFFTFVGGFFAVAWGWYVSASLWGYYYRQAVAKDVVPAPPAEVVP